MRRAKIVCTLGPASNSPEVIAKLIDAGMNVARLNFSHGTHEYHAELYETVRRVSREMNKPVAILQDLQGPKIRVGKFEEGAIELVEGSEFVITSEDILGDGERVSTTYKELPEDVRPGDILLINDGLLRMDVRDVRGGTDVVCEVIRGGTLKNNKGINLPTAAVSAPSLTDKDLEDLQFGLGLAFDYVALSFVRSGLDIHQLQSKIPRSRSNLKIISKIEKPQAIEQLDDIIAVSDGIMIARGDLGVELPPQKVPLIQKMAIRKANAMGRLSITATQMLESMTENAVPTRAEASDVANAVLDGSDAVMLSGETASGRYPVESVKMMASIIREVEGQGAHHQSDAPVFLSHLKNFPNAVAKAAATTADELDVLGIVVLTHSGATARLMMTYRPNKPILAYTPDPEVCTQMAAFWGVQPRTWSFPSGLERVVEGIEQRLKTDLGAKPGDEVLIVMGMPVEKFAETNTIKFHRLGD